MDPAILDDDELNNYKRIVTNLINNQYPDFNLHDFRLIRSNNNKKTLHFDCAIPSDYTVKKDDIKRDLEHRIKDTITNIECIITMDTIIKYSD